MFIVTSLLSLILAISIYMIRNDILIFMYPSHFKTPEITTQAKKTVTLYYWKHDRWNSETTELVWSNSTDQKIQFIINALCSLFEEEQIIKRKASIQSVTLNERETYCYISFDRSFLDKESSTFDKLMLLESMFKTIKENKITVQYVQLLVHHEPMKDTHLELSYPWPLSGFCNDKGNRVSLKGSVMLH